MNPLGGDCSEPLFYCLGGKLRCKINKKSSLRQIKSEVIFNFLNVRSKNLQSCVRNYDKMGSTSLLLAKKVVILHRFSRKVADQGLRELPQAFRAKV